MQSGELTGNPPSSLSCLSVKSEIEFDHPQFLHQATLQSQILPMRLALSCCVLSDRCQQPQSRHQRLEEPFQTLLRQHRPALLRLPLEAQDGTRA